MGKKGSAGPWISWDEYQVGSWMKKHGLERYATLFIENGITGENLPDCLDENKLAGAVKNVRDVEINPALTFCCQSSSIKGFGGRRSWKRYRNW